MTIHSTIWIPAYAGMTEEGAPAIVKFAYAGV